MPKSVDPLGQDVLDLQRKGLPFPPYPLPHGPPSSRMAKYTVKHVCFEEICDFAGRRRVLMPYLGVFLVFLTNCTGLLGL